MIFGSWKLTKFNVPTFSVALIEPTESSNNQRTFTETYHHIGKEYEVTYGFDIEGEPEPYVEEITELKWYSIKLKN